MIVELEILFWILLTSGIWFGAITQLHKQRTDREDIEDFFKYKY